MAYAAATTPADPQIVSVSWTGPDHSGGQPVGTTTTTIPQAGPAVDVLVTSDDSGGSVQQTIGVSVLPGPLTVAPATESVSLAQLHPFGGGEPTFRGDVSTVTVVDARGSLVGWRATVSLQGIAGVDARQLAHAQLCLAPHRPTMVAGNPQDVVRGAPRSCAGPGQSIPVFEAAPGGGGGTYSDTAGLVLVLPAGTPPGNLTGSLAVAVS
jgi:hypothetical protein